MRFLDSFLGLVELQLPGSLWIFGNHATEKGTTTMASDLTYALKRMASTWIMALLVLSGLVAVFGFGPELEPVLHPVLTSQTSRLISKEDGVYTFDMRFYKARPCRIEDSDWVLQKGETITWTQVYRKDGSPVGANASYQVGWLTIGPFHFTPPPGFNDPDQVYGVIYYDCHPGWLTRQILGPVRLR